MKNLLISSLLGNTLLIGSLLGFVYGVLAAVIGVSYMTPDKKFNVIVLGFCVGFFIALLYILTDDEI